jgi:AraC-like DNA-binding protein
MSTPTTPQLLTLDRDPHYAGLLATSLPFRVARVSGWHTLFYQAASSPASTVICVDPYFGAKRRALAPELSGLLLLLPSARVVATVDLSTVPLEDVLELGRLGVAEVVGRGPADVRAALQRIQALTQPRLVARIDRAFEGRVDPGIRALIRTAAELAGSGSRTSTLAGRLYVSDRTLLRACDRMGIPGPQQLMTWTKVLHAVALLDEPGRRVRDAARAAGFGSDRSMRRALHRLLGCEVERLRRPGAFARAVGRFVRALRGIPSPVVEPVRLLPLPDRTGVPVAGTVF